MTVNHIETKGVNVYYYLKHQGTEVIYFEKPENLLDALTDVIKQCESSCIEGYPFEITVGCTTKIEQQEAGNDR